MITGTLLGLLLGTLGIGWYGFERQRHVYEQLIQILERQCGEARHEAKVFRRLVLPVFDKAENSISVNAPPPTEKEAPVCATERGVAAPNPSAATPLMNRRTPFRIRWKQMAAAANTKQKNTDTLASAIASQNDGQSATQFKENSSHV